MGSEDTAVYIYDVSRGKRHAAVVNKLQVNARHSCHYCLPAFNYSCVLEL